MCFFLLIFPLYLWRCEFFAHWVCTTWIIAVLPCFIWIIQRSVSVSVSKRKSTGVMLEWVSYRYCTPVAAAFWDGHTGLRAARFSGLHRRCKKDCSQLHHHNYCHCDRRLLQVGKSRIVKECFESCVCACAATLDSSHRSPFIARGEQRTGEQASGSKAPEEIVY